MIIQYIDESFHKNNHLSINSYKRSLKLIKPKLIPIIITPNIPTT